MKTSAGVVTTLLLLTLSLLGQPFTRPSSLNSRSSRNSKASEILQETIFTGPITRFAKKCPRIPGRTILLLIPLWRFQGGRNDMLVIRVEEINAIARLNEVSKTDELKESLKGAAKSPVDTAKALVTDPVNTVAAIPKGIKKFLGRAGEA